MFRSALRLAVAGAAAFFPVVSAAQSSAPSADFHARAAAALPAAREALDSLLTDYPSARFRNVHARLVRSVYADDEGQNRVPWTHRGGLVVVFCGEINAKNRMGGYGGWQQFAFEPAQTDVAPIYDWNRHQPKPINLAAKPELRLSGDRFNDEWIGLLCGVAGDGELTDGTDLSSDLKNPSS